MFERVPVRSGLLVLAVGLGLWGGCDFLGIGPSEIPQPSFTSKSDLALRTTTIGGETEENASRGADAALSLTPVVQVRPPTVEATRTQASHLSYDEETRRVHVGYKLSGSDFGGAIDVLRVRPGAAAGGLVVGVEYDRAENAIYAVGAVTTKKARVSPAVISKVMPGDTEVKTQSTRLSHNVAKSVALGPSSSTVHVITDEDALFQFDMALESKSKHTVGDASGFRSAAVRGTEVFVLDRSGRVFQTDVRSFGPPAQAGRLTEANFGNGTVARLHAGDAHLHAALNEKGFALFSPTGEVVWQSESVSPSARYTSITTGPERIYVGRFDGRIEVYRRPDSSSGQDPVALGTYGPWGSNYGGGLSDAPVNHIRVIDGHLYLARSRDGLVVVRVDEG